MEEERRAVAWMAMWTSLLRAWPKGSSLNAQMACVKRVPKAKVMSMGCQFIVCQMGPEPHSSSPHSKENANPELRTVRAH